MKFTHLHVHSHYSLLDGLGKIDELIEGAKNLGMDSLAITDHGVMYGALQFYNKAKEAGIKPIIGCEVYLAPRRMNDRQPKIDNYPYHLVLLAKNETGYKNLVKIVSNAHLYGYYYKPRTEREELEKYSEGLIAMTACLQGEIPRLILDKKLSKVKEKIKWYQQTFGRENFYLELQSHPHLDEQTKVNETLIKLSEELNVPLIATNDVHYVSSEDKDAHEILLAVNTNKEVDDANRLSLKDFDISLKSTQIMQEAFANVPEALENSQKIVSQCNLELKSEGLILPHFKLPKGITSKQQLSKLAREGLEKKYGKNNKEAQERLEFELEVIENAGFSDYFLIVSDFVNWAKENGIIVGPGRGSAAGSIVTYCLNITELDPLPYNLLFERFLNPSRISPPDIDLDFQDDRRSEVIKYISDKYGADHVAQITTFGTMASRGSIRDVGRALGMAYGDVDQIAKLIPFGMTLSQSLEEVKELKNFYDSDVAIKKLIDMAKKLEGVARHASIHAAGIVITKKPLTEYLPLQRPAKSNELTEAVGGTVTQFPMNDIEKLGLLKIDLLGLANLTIIKNALRIIRKVACVEIDIKTIPMDDEKTYKLLAKAHTTGVFQLESDGMKRYLKELRPTSFNDIIAMVALYRPGPMEFIPDYIAGKHQKKEIKYLHPKLEPILKDTFGIAVYQEQIMQIARDLAGFTMSEADVLRKAMGKKIEKLLMEQKEKFIEGAINNGIDKEIAVRLFQFTEPFAKYGFNKSHAACYALIAYQTAYLKANFPGAFMAALLTSEQDNIEKIAQVIEECERMGIKVAPPDVNESFVEFGVIVENKKEYIRFGLAAIKNVGQGVSEQIVEERKNNGAYQDLEDFIDRLPANVVNKKVIESLAKSGALDKFGERNQLLAGTPAIIKYKSNVDSQANNGQLGLFGGADKEILKTKINLPQIDPANKKQCLAWERELLGIFLSEHPMNEYRELIKDKVTPINELTPDHANEKFTIAGIITRLQKIITRNKQPMVFATLEDFTGRVEVLVFPKALMTNALIWRVDNVVCVIGNLSNKDGEPKILVDKAFPIEEIDNLPKAKKIINDIFITIPGNSGKDLLLKIKEILQTMPGDCSVCLRISTAKELKEIRTKARVKPSKILFDQLGELVGAENISKR